MIGYGKNSIHHYWIWRWRKGAMSQDVASRNCKPHRNRFSPRTSKRKYNCQHLDFSQWDLCLTSNLQNSKIINVLFQATTFVGICYNRTLIQTSILLRFQEQNMEIKLIDIFFLLCRKSPLQICKQFSRIISALGNSHFNIPLKVKDLVRFLINRIPSVALAEKKWDPVESTHIMAHKGNVRRI